MISLASPLVGTEEQQQINDVLQSGTLTRGSATQSFENRFAEYCGTDHGIATANGTTALHAALHGLGLGEDDRVVTTPFSFTASTNAIRLCGATPVFADIDPETYNLDSEAAEEAIKEHDADAILVVHAYGLPAEMDAFVDLAEEHDLLLIEDAAEAHGTEYNGQRVGSFGDAGCFSFYATKNMTTGEGGIVTTDNENVAERIAQFIDHGRDSTGRCVEVGHNFHMSDLTAAVGLAQLEKLPKINSARRSNAKQLSENLSESVTTPTEPPNTYHTYYLYTIRTGDRDGLSKYLHENNIENNSYWSTPIYKEPVYESMGYSEPVTEKAAEEVLSLPVHPKLSTNEVEMITKTVNEYVGSE